MCVRWYVIGCLYYFIYINMRAYLCVCVCECVCVRRVSYVRRYVSVYLDVYMFVLGTHNMAAIDLSCWNKSLPKKISKSPGNYPSLMKSSVFLY